MRVTYTSENIGQLTHARGAALVRSELAPRDVLVLIHPEAAPINRAFGEDVITVSNGDTAGRGFVHSLHPVRSTISVRLGDAAENASLARRLYETLEVSENYLPPAERAHHEVLTEPQRRSGLFNHSGKRIGGRPQHHTGLARIVIV